MAGLGGNSWWRRYALFFSSGRGDGLVGPFQAPPLVTSQRTHNWVLFLFSYNFFTSFFKIVDSLFLFFESSWTQTKCFNLRSVPEFGNYSKIDFFSLIQRIFIIRKAMFTHMKQWSQFWFFWEIAKKSRNLMKLWF